MRTNDESEAVPSFIKNLLGIKSKGPQTAQEDAADARLEAARKEIEEVLVRRNLNFVGTMHFNFDNGRDGESSAQGIISRGHPHTVYCIGKSLWKILKRNFCKI